MLKKLFIENYALIDILEIEFSSGFSVITGETGAGKSILLGALALILGQRADTSVLLNLDKKCVVEGTFLLKNYHLEKFFHENELDYEELTLLRREINQNGKSRAFINDTPVNLNLMKELGDLLVNIHSQNSITILNERNFQLTLLDDYAGIQKELSEYRNDFNSFKKLEEKYHRLVEEENKAKSDLDYFQFQFNELETAAITEGEQSEAEQRLQILTHAEEIKSNLYKAVAILSTGDNSLIDQLRKVLQSISTVEKFQSSLEEIHNRLKSNLIDLQDISSDLEKRQEAIIYNPDELDYLTNRLDLIYKLEKKHHVETDFDLLRIKAELENKLVSISSLEDEIKNLKVQLDASRQNLYLQAVKLSDRREKVIPAFEKEICTTLHQLGMPDAKVKVEKYRLESFGFDGIDTLHLLFSSNKGIELDEISKIASGGELSRLMLSMKSLISRRNLLPTIIFDEIDMGVSGEVAGKVGAILKKMASTMQVIAITHLPQIAGTGDTHYWVYKVNENETTRSRIKKLTRDERILEIAKMLSSGTVTPSASSAALELLSD